MNPENRNCQNCKNDFAVTSDDLDFYAKLNVPAPLSCPRCRFERRLMFRNERVLYKRECGRCAKPIVTIFSPEGIQPVYCSSCWWGDEWDARDYGKEYDPTRPFFEQLKELRDTVPCMNLIVGYSSLVRSDYVNHAGASKDCYLMFNGNHCENVQYSTTVVHVKDSMDVTMAVNSELMYESIDVSGARVFFSDNCTQCVDTYFSQDCTGCVNVIGCFGLRNKSNHIFNKPVSKEEFDTFIKDVRLDTRAGIASMRAETEKFFLQFPRRAYRGNRNVNSTGSYIYDSKNAKDCYQVVGLEDGAYCQFLTIAPTRDAYDLTEWGMNSERIVDAITVGENCSNIKYCGGSWANSSDIEYSMYTVGSKDCFGCVNLRKGEYCILNTQYTKEEYETLKAQIIEDMTNNPYIDSKGRVFPYGEFLPYDLSFFAYNESCVQQYFPKSEKEIEDAGFKYREPDQNKHIPTVTWNHVPSSITEIPDTFTQEILGCVSCGKAYKITVAELSLLRRFNFPIPDHCPDCRHKRRLARTTPPYFYDRECQKCGRAIVTGISVDRPEIVYCESCYQKEIL